MALAARADRNIVGRPTFRTVVYTVEPLLAGNPLAGTDSPADTETNPRRAMQDTMASRTARF